MRAGDSWSTAGAALAGSAARTGTTCVLAVRSKGSRLQSCFSDFEEFLPGRSHWPDLLQHGWCLPGNMKYCSHETQPPHIKVATIKSENTELAMLRSITAFIIPHRHW